MQEDAREFNAQFHELHKIVGFLFFRFFFLRGAPVIRRPNLRVDSRTTYNGGLFIREQAKYNPTEYRVLTTWLGRYRMTNGASP